MAAQTIETFLARLCIAKRAALDTACFIYTFEDKAPYAELGEALFNAIHAGEIQALTSTISLSEVLVKPLELEDFPAVELYQSVFRSLPNFRVIAVDEHIAVAAARIRAAYHFELPDAIELATAIVGGAELFVTNDKALRSFDQLEVLVLGDFAK